MNFQKRIWPKIILKRLIVMERKIYIKKLSSSSSPRLHCYIISYIFSCTSKESLIVREQFLSKLNCLNFLFLFYDFDLCMFAPRLVVIISLLDVKFPPFRIVI
nr:hypothetical protein CFP56_59182 [Quercus suber]